MANSPLAAAVSVAALGAGAVPSFARWTPASVYLSLQGLLKSMILLPPVLLVVTAPFGRFALHDSLFKLPGRLAFMLMELPAPIVFLLAMATPEQLSHDKDAVGVGALLHALVNPSWAHVKQLPAANLLLGALFVVHYTHRAVLQPIFGPPRSPSHVSVLLSAAVFSVANGFSMGAWIGGRSPSLLVPVSLLSGRQALASPRAASWFAGILPRAKMGTSAGLTNTAILPVAQPGLLPHGAATLVHPLFLLGVVGWAIGFASNVFHDEILFNLRRPDKRGGGPAEGTRSNQNKASSTPAESTSTGPRYEIPEGGLYSLVSYPNYLSEWFEWFSYALAALSLSKLSPFAQNAVPLTLTGRAALLFAAPPFVFAVIEVAVMLPRAVQGHQWYHAKFGVEGDGKGGRYPLERKAVVPFVL